MNNPISISVAYFLVASTNIYCIFLVSRVKDLDNKVTMMQERQEQIIQLIEANHR
jgi:hypothetical protein